MARIATFSILLLTLLIVSFASGQETFQSDLRDKPRKKKSAATQIKYVADPSAPLCQDVVKYANTGRLRDLFGNGDKIKTEDGQTMRLEIKYQGTAHTASVYAYDTKTNHKKVFHLPSSSVWPLWGGDRLAVIPYLDGHYLLWYRDMQYPIEIIPLGITKAPFCRFKTMVHQVVSPESEEPELCNILLSNARPPFIEFNEEAEIKSEKIQDAGYDWTAAEGVAKIDVANNKKMEQVIKLSIASQAGPGCDGDFFDILTSDGLQIAETESAVLLSQLQQLNKNNPRIIYCCRNKTGWFKYKGKIYFENTFVGDEPRDLREHYHEVARIENGKIHRVCEFKFTTNIISTK